MTPFSFSLPINRRGTQALLIVDIGSASVGGAFVVVKKSGGIRIQAAVREPMVFQKTLDAVRFRSAMLEALDRVLRAIRHTTDVRPEAVLCVLSSPWHIAHTEEVSEEKKRQFVITHRHLEELLAGRALAFAERARQTNPRGEAVELFETEALRIKLNGYETTDPYGALARRIDIALHASAGPSKTLGAIRKHIQDTYNLERVSFRSFPLASFTVARDLFAEERSFLLLDVTGEVTDVSLVRNNALARSTSFPAGSNTMLRDIAEAFHTVPEEARSLLLLYFDGRAELSTSRKIERVLGAFQKTWMREFSDALARFHKEIALPPLALFTADADIARWFEHALEHETFIHLTLTGGSLDVRCLGEEILEPFVDYASGVPRDAFLALEALFVNKTVHGE